MTTFGTAGHTPGHISIHISSGSEEMLLTGDVLVDSEVSFLHPEWPFGFDVDVPMGTKARMAFLDRAAADKTLVGIPATLPWLRARSARGEPLSLAAGRLAVNELMATSTSPSRQLQLQAKENSHEY